jgi:hypothetical protein
MNLRDSESSQVDQRLSTSVSIIILFILNSSEFNKMDRHFVDMLYKGGCCCTITLCPLYPDTMSTTGYK